jgi:hypothetical protein
MRQNLATGIVPAEQSLEPRSRTGKLFARVFTTKMRLKVWVNAAALSSWLKNLRHFELN